MNTVHIREIMMGSETSYTLGGTKVDFSAWYHALEKELEGTVRKSVLSKDGTRVALTYKERNFELVFTRKSILRNRLTPTRVGWII
jgi:hypothetical protein